ncbi:MAG: hypothetical protein HQK49_03070 [Oligoflexia bacterium]|nr:hypothetical protein [Oligoflexia bacterium]
MIIVNHNKYQKFFSCCQNISSKILSMQLQKELFSTPIETPDLIGKVLMPNTGLIILSGADFTIFFKIMFSRKTLKDIINNSPSNEKIDDFIKECCNQTVGKLKEIFFNTLKISLAISLPLKISGFDELYFSLRKEDLHFFYWKIFSSDTEFICSLEIESISDFNLDNFNLLEFNENLHVKDVEFL